VRHTHSGTKKGLCFWLLACESSHWRTYHRPWFQLSLTYFFLVQNAVLFHCLRGHFPLTHTVQHTSHETNAKFASNRTTLETLTAFPFLSHHRPPHKFNFTVPCHGPPQPQILPISVCIGSGSCTTWGK